MRFGVCAKLSDLTRGVLGLDYVETTVQDALCPAENEEAFSQRLEAVQNARVPVESLNLFFPSTTRLTGPGVDNESLDRYVATVLSRAGRAGVKVIAMGSGTSRRFPVGFDRLDAEKQLVEHLQRWGSPATNVGIVIALEPLRKPETNLVNTVTEGAELIRRVNQPSIRLLADTFHMAQESEPPEAIRQAVDVLAHVHCAQSKGRGPLEAAGEDLRPYFRVLKEAGYARRISIEAGWKDLGAQLPGAIEELRRQVETA
jgi:sugar phosphate isomerase/epimerase